MAYDRYDREMRWREGRRDPSEDRGPRGWDRGDDRDRDFNRSEDDRGFLGRMGDEFRSWFGDEDRERGPDFSRDRGQDREDRQQRSRFDEPSRPQGWSRDEERTNRGSREERDRDYRPLAGDYGRSGGRDSEDRDTEWSRDPYRRTSFAGSRARSNHDDLHYDEWRRRQMEGLDRDYHDYRRERQSHFEDDFGNWRQRRMSKRELLRDIREHMEVVGSDEQHVGTVDRVAGDRIILTRSDPESGGVHHSLSCADVDRIENGRVILDCNAEKARERWRDEDRERALFEREDQGRAGPGILDRSFSGTYR
jgi:hypothetical protein